MHSLWTHSWTAFFFFLGTCFVAAEGAAICLPPFVFGICFKCFGSFITRRLLLKNYVCACWEANKPSHPPLLSPTLKPTYSPKLNSTGDVFSTVFYGQRKWKHIIKNKVGLLGLTLFCLHISAILLLEYHRLKPSHNAPQTHCIVYI